MRWCNFACCGLLIGALLSNGNATAYTVIGTVSDSKGVVVPEADVWISQDRYVRTVSTDERGRYFFADVSAGPVELVARRAGLAIGGATGQIVDDGNVAIVLGEPDTIRIRVIDPSGKPVEGARLKSIYVGNAFYVAAADLLDFGFPSIRSDEEGYLTLDELPTGSHAALSIVHRRYAENGVPTLPVGTELDVRLREGRRLRGRVTNANGDPIERARVSVFRGEKEFTEVLSESDGFYTALVPDGSYQIAARHPEYAMPDPVGVITEEDGAVANLTLPPPHIIRGMVHDTSGEAVSGTRISYIARDILFQEAVSDVAGEFSVTVSAGKGFLRVIPPYRMYTERSPDIPFELTDARLIELDPITLAALPEIEGRIEVRDGARADKVIVSTLGLQHAKRTVTDAEGRFRLQLDAMPSSEEVRLRAEHGLRFQRREFDVNLRRLREQKERLRAFEPDLSPPPAKPPNRLHHMVGDPAPEIACDAWFNLPEDSPDGITLESLRGEVVVLTLWGGWDFIGAGPDRTDELNRLYEIFEDQEGVRFVSVHDASTSAEEVQQYVQHYGIRFPVGLDAAPTLTFDSYNVNTIPQTVLIDRQGVVRYFHVDGRLAELIKSLRRES